MLMNLTDVFATEGKDIRESFIYEADMFSYMGSSYPICEKSPAEVAFTNAGIGKAVIRGKMKLILEIPCDRCLQPVKAPLNIEFENEVFSPEAVDQHTEQSFMDGWELDLTALINSEILINMPVKVLCKPECKGICAMCGHNLNGGDCGCDTFVPDPRMAAIKDIFNANKEV